MVAGGARSRGGPLAERGEPQVGPPVGGRGMQRGRGAGHANGGFSPVGGEGACGEGLAKHKRVK